MKKLSMTLMAVLFALTCVPAFTADAKDQTKQADPAKRSVFQIGFFPGVPNSTRDYNVYGIKIGAPMVDGLHWVYGVEASVLYSGTFYVKGCQATLAGPALAIRVEGMQATCGPAFVRELIGFQAGTAAVILNEGYGCQAGIASVANHFKGFQTGAVNVTYNVLDGFQFGGVNVVDDTFAGCQIGGVNVASARFKGGVQVGVVNIAPRNGFQIGGINIMPAAWIPVLPFFNYAPEKKQKTDDAKAAQTQTNVKVNKAK